MAGACEADHVGGVHDEADHRGGDAESSEYVVQADQTRLLVMISEARSQREHTSWKKKFLSSWSNRDIPDHVQFGDGGAKFRVLNARKCGHDISLC